jgi:hypothetical protein
VAVDPQEHHCLKRLAALMMAVAVSTTVAVAYPLALPLEKQRLAPVR